MLRGAIKVSLDTDSQNSVAAMQNFTFKSLKVFEQGVLF